MCMRTGTYIPSLYPHHVSSLNISFPKVIMVNFFFCIVTYMAWHFWNKWQVKGILEMTALQQIMLLFSIKMLKHTPESCSGKESLNIVLHRKYAGTIMFHKTLTLALKYSKHPWICSIKIMPSFFFPLILAPVAVSVCNCSPWTLLLLAKHGHSWRQAGLFY